MVSITLFGTCFVAGCSYDATLKGYGAKTECGEKVGSTCTTTEGPTTSVATDETSCIALAIHEQETAVSIQIDQMRRAGLSKAEALELDPSLDWNFPPANERAYRAALKAGRIADLKAGTKIKQIELLFAVDGWLVKPYATTDDEMQKQGIAEVLWVTVKEGPLREQRVCLPSSEIWPRFGPWP